LFIIIPDLTVRAAYRNRNFAAFGILGLKLCATGTALNLPTCFADAMFAIGFYSDRLRYNGHSMYLPVRLIERATMPVINAAVLRQRL
jgi:hypothetical protein